MSELQKPRHCRDCSAWSSSAFAFMSEAELNDLQEKKTGFQRKRGESLNRLGAQVDGAYCMARGFAKIIRLHDDDKECIIKLVSKGQLSGYRCLFSEDTFRATAVALGPVEGCYIPKDNFLELMKNDFSFNQEILKRMGQEIKLSEQRLFSFCQKSVRERMAESLLFLKEQCGVERDGKWILEIQFTREEMSFWIGTAKETVVRCLSDMKDEKVIEQYGQYIALIDIKALEKIAGTQIH